MSEFKIEKNVAVPSRKHRGKYPFPQMNVGDSFFVPGETGNKLRSSSNWFGKRNPPFKFICRKVEGGMRVWRIK